MFDLRPYLINGSIRGDLNFVKNSLKPIERYPYLLKQKNLKVLTYCPTGDL